MLSSPVIRISQICTKTKTLFTIPVSTKKGRFFCLNMSFFPKWKYEKDRILGLSLAEKRKLYKSGKYVTHEDIATWGKYAIENNVEKKWKHTLDDLTQFQKIELNKEMNPELIEKVSIFKGDITQLEVDAIVNAANSYLRAGGGVDGAIHRAAGPVLQDECNSLNGCSVGDAKVTGGYNLPAKYVIHTVGPQDGSEKALESCYLKCLSYRDEYELETIAFPCISTGIYGFPNRLAGHIALRTARKFLEEKHLEVHRIIFCLFTPVDIEVYETLMQMYFPLHDFNYVDGASVSE